MENRELKKVPTATRRKALSVAQILHGSEYALTLFTADEVGSLGLWGCPSSC